MSTKNAPGCLEKMNEWPLTTLDQIFFRGDITHFSSRFGFVCMFEKKGKNIFKNENIWKED